MNGIELQRLACAVASELGPEWALEPVPYQNAVEHVVRIGTPAGESLSVNGTWGGPGRLKVSGNFPAEPPTRHNEPRPSVTVSDARPPKAIAADIARRLLPAYRELLARTIAAKREADACREAAEALARRIAAPLGVTPAAENRHAGGDQARNMVSLSYGTGAWGTIRAGSDGTARLDLHRVPADTAERIAALLAEQPAEPVPA